MDGTLIDSAGDHFQAWQETLAAEGFTLTRENFAAYFGRRNDDIIRAYLGSDVATAKLDRISLAKEERYRSLIRRRGVRTLPGVRQWVARLAAAGWRQTVASSAPRANVEAALRILGWRDALSGFVAAEDVANAKPDPEVFLRAAASMGVPPARCVVLEDAPAGIEAARRAGMRSVGICTLHGQLNADYAVASLEDLAAEAFDLLVPV
jgi:beta-phosphoglucomutase